MKIGSKISYINKLGKQPFAETFEAAGQFQNGEAIIVKGKKRFIINNKGRILKEAPNPEEQEKEERKEMKH